MAATMRGGAAVTVPEEVERWLREATERTLTGSITLHFVGGELRTWERKETGRKARVLTAIEASS